MFQRGTVTVSPFRRFFFFSWILKKGTFGDQCSELHPLAVIDTLWQKSRSGNSSGLTSSGIGCSYAPITETFHFGWTDTLTLQLVQGHLNFRPSPYL